MKYIWAVVFAIITNSIFAQNLPNTPHDVVKYALNALTNGDVQRLVSVTENAELRSANQLLDAIKTTPEKKDELLQQYTTVKSWDIEDTEEYNINGRNIVVVSTKWIVTKSVEQTTATTNKIESIEKTIFVDYMLEKFNHQWKIISHKSLN